MEIKNKWVIRDSFYPLLRGKYCVLNSFFKDYKPTEVRGADLQSISLVYCGDEYKVTPYSRVTLTWDIIEVDALLSKLGTKAIYVIANMSNTTVCSDDLVVKSTEIMSGLLSPDDVRLIQNEEFKRLIHTDTALYVNSNALSSRDPRLDSGSLKIIDSEGFSDGVKGHIRAFSVRIQKPLDIMKINSAQKYLEQCSTKVDAVLDDSTVEWGFYVGLSNFLDDTVLKQGTSILHKATTSKYGFESNIRCIDKSLENFNDVVEYHQSSLNLIDYYANSIEFGVYISISDRPVEFYDHIITKLKLSGEFIIAVLHSNQLPTDTDLVHLMTGE